MLVAETDTVVEEVGDGVVDADGVEAGDCEKLGVGLNVRLGVADAVGKLLLDAVRVNVGEALIVALLVAVWIAVEEDVGVGGGETVTALLDVWLPDASVLREDVGVVVMVEDAEGVAVMLLA